MEMETKGDVDVLGIRGKRDDEERKEFRMEDGGAKLSTTEIGFGCAHNTYSVLRRFQRGAGEGSEPDWTGTGHVIA